MLDSSDLGDLRGVRRRKTRAAVVISAASALASAFGCVSTDVYPPDCTLTCEADCPAGYSCMNGYCARSANATCGKSDAGGSGTDASRTRGVTPTVTPAESGTTPNPPHVEAGTNTPDASSVDSGELTLTLQDSPAACSGQALTLTFAVSDGEAPYTWSLHDGTDFTLVPRGATATVSGTPSSTGNVSFDVAVTDAKGKTASHPVTLPVRDTPRITTSTLPPTCVGQNYTAPLNATGGETSAYVWSAPLPDGSTAVQGKSLSLVPPATGTQTFSVTVSDGHCTSAAVNLSLQVDDLDACPTITTKSLPGACIGGAYNPTSVAVSGGKGRLVVVASKVPEGLSFDADSMTLSGVGQASGDLSLGVTDSAGHHSEKTLSVAARDRCWFAYLTGAPAPGLHFYDPVFHLYDPVVTTDRDFAKGADVTDFAFSPDGHSLVYRTTTGGASELVLIVAPDWKEQPLSFTGSVDHYTWSADSTTLAVSYHGNSGPSLGGVRLSASSAGDGGTESSPQYLDPTPVQVSSAISWRNAESVVFLVPGDFADTYDLHVAALEAEGFATPVDIPNALLSAQASLHVTASGVFTLDPFGDGDLGFFGGLVKDAYFGDFITATPDPLGVYAGLAAAGNLQIQQTVLNGDLDIWATSTAGCDSLVAWSPVGEHIACANDDHGTPVNNHATLFTLDGTKTLNGVRITDSENYDVGTSTTHRRAFSPNGNWFAFTSSTHLYVADLRDSTPHVVTRDTPLTAVPSDHTDELAFSPDEKRLLWQSGAGLKVRDLVNTSGTAVSVDPDLIPAPPCVEHMTSDPDNWCGRNSSKGAFVWSPDSRLSATHHGTRIDVYEYETNTFVTPCQNNCSGQFTFQP
jgi:hypothetical protein